MFTLPARRALGMRPCVLPGGLIVSLRRISLNTAIRKAHYQGRGSVRRQTERAHERLEGYNDSRPQYRERGSGHRQAGRAHERPERSTGSTAQYRERGSGYRQSERPHERPERFTGSTAQDGEGGSGREQTTREPLSDWETEKKERLGLFYVPPRKPQPFGRANRNRSPWDAAEKEERMSRAKYEFKKPERERRVKTRGSVSPKYAHSAYAKRPEPQPRPGEGPFVQTKSFLVPPSTIPCTTAASEFIYGTSAVQAAIQCARRKLYVLYIYDVGENKPLSRTYWEDPLMKTLQKYALLAGAKVKRVRGPWLKMMDKMSDGRPHNNVILEASPLPRLPAASFDMVESPTAREFYVKLNSQPQENAEINGTDGRIQLACYRRTKESIFDDPEPEDKPPRYPLVLLLDGILDEGNLGGIIRSAHYLGVDAVAFSARNSAPLSPVTMKAAAGAAESIPLISVHDPRTLITKSRENGWRFFAAEAPSSARSDKNQSRAVLDPPDLASQLQISPCVLMLGGEGSGLSRMLSNSADSFVAIPGVYTPTPEVDKAGVDSLNVSVATAILCEAFLRLPSGGESASQIAPLQTPPMEKDEQSPEEKDEQVMF